MTLRVEGAASLLNGLGEVHGLASFPPPKKSKGKKKTQVTSENKPGSKEGTVKK